MTQHEGRARYVWSVVGRRKRNAVCPPRFGTDAPGDCSFVGRGSGARAQDEGGCREGVPILEFRAGHCFCDFGSVPVFTGGGTASACVGSACPPFPARALSVQYLLGTISFGGCRCGALTNYGCRHEAIWRPALLSDVCPGELQPGPCRARAHEGMGPGGACGGGQQRSLRWIRLLPQDPPERPPHAMRHAASLGTCIATVALSSR